jgi:hypothetical protein
MVKSKINQASQKFSKHGNTKSQMFRTSCNYMKLPDWKRLGEKDMRLGEYLQRNIFCLRKK